MNWMHWRNGESGCKLLQLLLRNKKEAHLVEEVETKEGDEVTGISSLFPLVNLQVEREAGLCGEKKLHHILQQLQIHQGCWLQDRMD